MQIFMDFLVNNYLWFLIISLVLIFALIGYLVDTSEQNKAKKAEGLPDLDNFTPENMAMPSEEVLTINSDTTSAIETK